MTGATVKHTNRSLYQQLLTHTRNYWPHIAAIFFVNLLSAPLQLLAPLPLKIAVDSVLGSAPFPTFLADLLAGVLTTSGSGVLMVAAGLVVLIALFQQVQDLGNWLLQTYTGERLILDFRSLLFSHAQRLSLSRHDSRGTYDTIYRISYDAPAIRWVIIDCFIPLITLAVTIAAMIYITAEIDHQMALVALAVVPVIFFATYIYGPRLRRNWGEVWNLRSFALSVVQEVLTTLRIVKAFGQENRERERLAHRSLESVRAHLRVALQEGKFNLIVGLTTSVGTAAVLYIGVHHVQAGALTLGQLLIVMSYLVQIYVPLKTMGQQVAFLQGAVASLERAFALLAEPFEVVEHPRSRRILRASGALTFRNVTFAYDGNHPVLCNISFEIDPAARLGIVGASGAGKTTLVSLLTRFYDPSDGQILLDGVDLRQYKLADLRNQFAIVLQEPVLFSTSIAENISYGRPGANFQEVVDAAKAANAHNFIESLPDGYNTFVGERGMQLSGGERQRIALARAFLKDAPILILDEPTSAIDLTTEAGIMEAMERLMAGRTVFLIAHRTSTLQKCNVLLILENGRRVSLTSDVSPALKKIQKLDELDALRRSDTSDNYRT